MLGPRCVCRIVWATVAIATVWVLMTPVRSETFASHIWGQPGAQPRQRPVYARGGQNMQNVRRQTDNTSASGFVAPTQGFHRTSRGWVFVDADGQAWLYDEETRQYTRLDPDSEEVRELGGGPAQGSVQGSVQDTTEYTDDDDGSGGWAGGDSGWASGGGGGRGGSTRTVRSAGGSWAGGDGGGNRVRTISGTSSSGSSSTKTKTKTKTANASSGNFPTGKNVKQGSKTSGTAGISHFDDQGEKGFANLRNPRDYKSKNVVAMDPKNFRNLMNHEIEIEYNGAKVRATVVDMCGDNPCPANAINGQNVDVGTNTRKELDRQLKAQGKQTLLSAGVGKATWRCLTCGKGNGKGNGKTNNAKNKNSSNNKNNKNKKK